MLDDLGQEPVAGSGPYAISVTVKGMDNILQLSSESSSYDEKGSGNDLIILRTSAVCVFSGPVASAQSQALACC